MTLRFADWLFNQRHRKDDIGDLARVLALQDIGQKFSKHKVDEHKSWADIVTKIDAPGHIFAFNEAWQEFLLARHLARNAVNP